MPQRAWGPASTTAALVMTLAALGCTGASEFVQTSGACTTARETCEARCARLNDDRECKEACLGDARRCMKAQGRTGGETVAQGEGAPRISELKALLVDFDGARPKHSPELAVRLSGEVEPFEGAHRLHPGGGVGIEFTLPDDLREAEVVIQHAPEGDGTNCFVTITVGDHPLASRYAPPRSKNVAQYPETWNLTPLLDALRAQQARGPLVLYIYNNQAAGSAAPYRLRSVQFLYRTLARVPGAADPEEGLPTRSLSAPP